MYLVLGICVLIGILVVAHALREKGETQDMRSRSARSLTDEEDARRRRAARILQENEAWLKARWANAKREKADGTLKTVREWFFDEATPRQIERLENEGLIVKPEELTKGEASDLIGLFEPIEDESEEILRFFKVPLRGMNQSRARHEIGQIFSDPANVTRWEDRPASPMEKEFYRFVGEKPQKNLTHKEAVAFRSEYLTNHPDGERLGDEWDLFESIWDDLDDQDFREDYDIKKVSLSLHREAVSQLREAGATMDELIDDMDIVVNKILELKPDLRRS
jgi:hypothetical protein